MLKAELVSCISRDRLTRIKNNGSSVLKKILITGANSYVGMSVEKWLSQWPDRYDVTTIDMIGDGWKSISFRGYDVIFHVAGVVHVKETKKNQGFFFDVNRDLTYKTAKKAVSEGVSQFIYLSSMSVYGLKSGIIDESTKPQPITAYGRSKLEAEELIAGLDKINISIIRPPIVYGKGCPGNYQKLSRIARRVRLFPKIENSRSMLYIDNLAEFVRLLIENKEAGVFFPQNAEYVATSELVELIANIHGRQPKFTTLFNPLIRSLKLSILVKAFGNLAYAKEMSEYAINYRVRNVHESIEMTER